MLWKRDSAVKLLEETARVSKSFQVYAQDAREGAEFDALRKQSTSEVMTLSADNDEK